MREQPKTVNGTVHTHDWEVFVKGTDGNKLENVLEKVNSRKLPISMKLLSLFIN